MITELEPNESKVRTDKGNSDQGIDDQYNDRMRHDNFENEDWNENVRNFNYTSVDNNCIDILGWTSVSGVFEATLVYFFRLNRTR